jgi:Zn-finger nucleic acid-binding protein
MIERGNYGGRVDEPTEQNGSDYELCPFCGRWFDRRDLEKVMARQRRPRWRGTGAPAPAPPNRPWRRLGAILDHEDVVAALQRKMSQQQTTAYAITRAESR